MRHSLSFNVQTKYATFVSACNVWYTLGEAESLSSSSRFGHSAVMLHNSSSMLVIGGFNGKMLNDTSLVYHPGNCSALTSRQECVTSRLGVACAWVDDRECVAADRAAILEQRGVVSSVDTDPNCPQEDDDVMLAFCSTLTNCAGCVSTLLCDWCPNDKCQPMGRCEKTKVRQLSE